MSLVNWSIVSLSKDFGGLGIRNMQMFYMALLAKLGWRLANEFDSLWAQVIGNKYFKADWSVLGISHRPHALTTWQGLVKASRVLAKG
ncbi:conserved hypothetical protein [Ricinus communis]|uniref:Uncharacterized protein n=1 Tax=Ricinus communis TaxID=3988 RepID=B9T1L4_RICCO|nr:conserved hypothetical protein [Ricinus communis]